MPAVQQPRPIIGVSPEIPVDGSIQRQNAGFLAPGQTLVAVNLDGISTPAGTTTIPLPIPPAGKMWMITDISITHDQSTGQVFKIQAGGVTVFSTQAHGSLAPDIIPAQETQIDLDQFSAPTLVVTGASGMHIWVNLAGIQQSDGIG